MFGAAVDGSDPTLGNSMSIDDFEGRGSFVHAVRACVRACVPVCARVCSRAVDALEKTTWYVRVGERVTQRTGGSTRV